MIMYRVMIIDDEQSARRLLRASIPWESLNMEVVGEAASGIEAINGGCNAALSQADHHHYDGN